MVLALVQKEPFAGRGGAGAHILQSIGGQKLGGLAGERPERGVQVVLRGIELPFKVSTRGNEPGVLCSLLHIAVQDREGWFRHGTSVGERVENFAYGFPHLDGGLQGSLRGGVLTPSAQMIRVLVRQNSRFLGKAREITIAGEQLLRMIAEAIVESVDEVQAHGSRDQFKLRRAAQSLFLSVNFLFPELLSIM